jgi:Uma2 family endonuclease
MPTLVLDPAPIELRELIERRRRLDQDRFDEVWEGVLHMHPAPSYEHQRVSQQLAELLGPLARSAGLEPVIGGVNIGVEDDYRIPDASLHLPGTGGRWLQTAVLAVEIVSPGDETWQKFQFYAARGVQELVIVDPREQKVEWFALRSGQCRPVHRSAVIELGPNELATEIEWP